MEDVEEEVEEIIQLACKVFGLTRDELLPQDHAYRLTGHPSAKFSSYRIATYSVIREVTGLSYPIIGRLVGRDHTTILSGIKTLNQSPQKRALRAQLIMEWEAKHGPLIAESWVFS